MVKRTVQEKESASDPGKGERIREKIVDHALRQAARGGMGVLSIGRLAKEVKMSKSGLFVHFGSKEKLETAVLERAGNLFFDHVLVPAEDEDLEGIEQLWVLCDLWLKFVERHVLPGSYFFTGALFHCAGQEGPIPERITKIVWRWLKGLKVAIERARSLGELDNGIDAKRTAMELNGLLVSAQWCYVMEGEDRTQARGAILAKLASLATDKIPVSAFESVRAWTKYLEDKHA